MVVLVVDNDEHKALDSEQGLVDYHVTVGSRVDSEGLVEWACGRGKLRRARVDDGRRLWDINTLLETTTERPGTLVISLIQAPWVRQPC